MKNHGLAELLTDRPIVHPTRIDGVSWRGSRLIIQVRGYRWWENPYSDRQTEGQIALVFEGVGHGCLLTDEIDPQDDEALEDFEINLVSDVPWAQACDWSIYCSGAIPQPLTLYVTIHDYLYSNSSFLTAEHFLNQANDLSRFAAMTQTSGFLVARGPTCIRDLVCEDLVRQSVPHNVVRTVADTEPKFLVRLGNSAFLCESARAELQG
jgi:hypothetical protein